MLSAGEVFILHALSLHGSIRVSAAVIVLHTLTYMRKGVANQSSDSYLSSVHTYFHPRYST